MLDMSMLYIGLVVLVLVVGFVFALRVGIAAALDADRQWPATADEPERLPVISPTGYGDRKQSLSA